MKARHYDINVFLFFCLLLVSCCYTNPSTGDCIVGEWSQWSTCNRKCFVGVKTQKLTIIKQGTDIFAKACPKVLTRTSQCGIPNNGCEKFCEERTGNCECNKGFTLKSDKKNCEDLDECKQNFGRGLCSQLCTNYHGSYKCSCYSGFNLLPDGYDCYFNSSSRPCDLKTHRYNLQGKCVCKNKLDGLKCDRIVGQCPESLNPCANDELCMKFKHAVKRCFPKKKAIPILFPIPFKNFEESIYRYEMEEYIVNILEGKDTKTLGNNFVSKRRKRNTLDLYYVEGSRPIEIKSYTYVEYIVSDIINDFAIVDGEQLCSKFVGKDIHCLNNKECNLLKSVGETCLFVYTPQFSKQTFSDTSSVKTWVLVLICVLLLVFFLGFLVFILKRRGIKFKRFSPRMFLSNNRGGNDQQNESPLQTVTYSCPPPPYSREDNLPNIQTFDTHVFDSAGVSFSNHEDGDYSKHHLYESVDNIKNRLNITDQDIYVPMESNGKEQEKQRKLVVDLPEYEPRYTQAPTKIISTGVETPLKIDLPKEEPHYTVPTNNRPSNIETSSSEEEE